MSSEKYLFKLGTFVKNVLLSKPDYRMVAIDLGIDKQTDPEYVLEEVSSSASECLHEILELAKKNNNMRECVEFYVKTKESEFSTT